MVAHADYRKHAQDDYNKMLKDQMMNDMANKDQMRMAERMHDRNEVAQKNAAYMSIDQMEKNQKAQFKMNYKDMLDQQIKIKNSAAYGNMSNVEKQMNRDDLIAYKKYDNN